MLLYSACLRLGTVGSVHVLQLFCIMAYIRPIVTNITLDGSNYLKGSFCVETVLRDQGLYSHLTVDPP